MDVDGGKTWVALYTKTPASDVSGCRSEGGPRVKGGYCGFSGGDGGGSKWWEGVCGVSCDAGSLTQSHQHQTQLGAG